MNFSATNMQHQLIYVTIPAMDKLGPSTMNKSVSTAGAKNWDQPMEEYDARSRVALTAKSEKVTTSRQPARQKLALIWADPEIDLSDGPFKSDAEYFKHSVTNIHTFQDTKTCIDFFDHVQGQTVFMIISDTLAEDILPKIHDIPELDSIYMFCGQKIGRTQWKEKWSKVKIASSDFGYICSSVEQCFRQYEQDSIPLAFYPQTRSPSNEFSDAIDSPFTYMKILADAICYAASNDETLVKNFATYCRGKKLVQASIIDHFEKKFKESSALSWYTNERFLHSMINGALLTEDLELINKMKFFIGSLHKEIESLHEQQREDQHQSILVYRGQGISRRDFDLLNKSMNGLISFNNFLSATKSREAAFVSAQNASTNPTLVGIIFSMNINSKSPVVPFAFLDATKNSKNSEPEILFSMNPIFRIDKISPNDTIRDLYEVTLTLIAAEDSELSALSTLISDKTGDSIGLERLGKWLIKSDETDRAGKVCNILLQEATDDQQKASFINRQRKYSKATSFDGKSLESKEKFEPRDELNLAKRYINLALMFDNIGQYSKAHEACQKALEIAERIFRSDQSELATYYYICGSVQSNMCDYEKALTSYRKAISIRQSTLPSNHPELAQWYSSIGSLYDRMGEYSKALSFMEKSLKIREELLTENHPDLATSYNNCGLIHMKVAECFEPFSLYQEQRTVGDVDVSQKPPATGINIGTGAEKSNASHYSMAISMINKALKIREKALPSNHPDLADAYASQARAQAMIAKYAEALDNYAKARKIYENLSSYPLSLAQVDNEIGLVHDSLGNSLQALAYVKKAFESR